MTRLHWILLVVVMATWLPSYLWYFRRDAISWWKRRAAARRQRVDQAVARARLNDELAAKYFKQAADPGSRP